GSSPAPAPSSSSSTGTDSTARPGTSRRGSPASATPTPSRPTRRTRRTRSRSSSSGRAGRPRRSASRRTPTSPPSPRSTAAAPANTRTCSSSRSSAASRFRAHLLFRPTRGLACGPPSEGSRADGQPQKGFRPLQFREGKMASVEQVPGTEETTAEVVNTVVEEGARLGVKRFFTIPGRDPFDEIEWETRDAVIPGRDGPAFEQRGVEFPKFWSQTATNIVAQKYFRGRLSSPERESSVKQMIGRVVATVVAWGKEGGYFADADEADSFEAELKAILVNQYASFNSPVWFNVGFEETPQCSACFILSIDDSMESILDWIRREGVIFRGGSGSGVNLSRLRSSKEQLSKGGHASGPVSVMRGADASAGTIKSGGKTRRAAKMVVLDVDHPDVEEFIWCKAHEERKARVLEQAGYDMSLDSPDWASIQYQNANNSVRVSDTFMEAATEGREFNLTARTDGAVVQTVDARDLLRQVA